MLSVAVPLLAGGRFASEEVSVAVTTPRSPHLAHQDWEDTEAHQPDQEAFEAEDSAEDSRVVVEVDSGEDSTAHEAEEVSEADLITHAVVVEEAMAGVVAALDISKTASVELQTAHQQVLAAHAVEGSVEIVEEDMAIVRNTVIASKVLVEATASQLDPEEAEVTATAISTVAAVLVVEMAVVATTESVLTMVMDTMAAVRREGTDCSDVRFGFSPLSLSYWHLDFPQWRCGPSCASLLLPFPDGFLDWTGRYPAVPDLV